MVSLPSCSQAAALLPQQAYACPPDDTSKNVPVAQWNNCAFTIVGIGEQHTLLCLSLLISSSLPSSLLSPFHPSFSLYLQHHTLPSFPVEREISRDPTTVYTREYHNGTETFYDKFANLSRSERIQYKLCYSLTCTMFCSWREREKEGEGRKKR